MKQYFALIRHQRTQFLIVLMLVVISLFLLGTWGSSSTVQATTNDLDGQWSQAGAIFRYQVMTGTLTHTLYFPVVKLAPTSTPTPTPTFTPSPTPTPTQSFIFFDDFSNTNSGWIVGDDGDDCLYEYRDEHYRITIRDDNGERCVSFNTTIPKTVYGTFSVRIRRTTPDDREVRYGFYFGAGVNAQEDRWFLEVMPHDVDCDGDDEGFFWLSAIEDGDDEFFEDQCTASINTDEDEWNELKVVRTSSTIDIYINGELKGEYDEDDNVDDILEDHGFFNLVVVGVDDISSSDPVIVEFDDFKVE